MEETLKKLDELDAIHKKMDLLERKHDRMGLNREESLKLKELRNKYYEELEIVIEKSMNGLLDILMSADGKKSLNNIKRKVPWSGGKIINFEEFEEILDAIEKLTPDEIDDIEEDLITLHADVFKGFENFCSTKEIYNALNEIGQHISLFEDGGIIDVVNYIDNIYKDFAEIFGIILPEIKLRYY